MNNQKEIKPLDIPAIGKQMSDQMDAWMYAQLFNERICSLCKEVSGAHTYKYHPFFNNNLEYLEWESGRR